MISGIDIVASMITKKGGSKLRGIELLRSKVRLVIVLKRFLGVSMQQFVAPENVDIFVIRVQAPPPSIPTPPPKQVKEDDGCAMKELLGVSKSRYEKSLCRKVLKKIVSLTCHMLIEKGQKEQQICDALWKKEIPFIAAVNLGA